MTPDPEYKPLLPENYFIQNNDIPKADKPIMKVTYLKETRIYTNASEIRL